MSIGTVDRALNDRPGISPTTRTRVLETARTLGYRPNLAARFLSSERRLRIGANLPIAPASFWDLVRGGLMEAARARPPSHVRLAPHVVMRSNLKLFLERLRSTTDGPAAPAGEHLATEPTLA